MQPFTLPPHFREQMARRKMLWNRKEEVAKSEPTKNKWESTQFKEDSDKSVSSKFLKLMGLKNGGAATSGENNYVDEESTEKRQQMLSTMERQYETARQVTHKLKGKGLGSGKPVGQKKYF